MFVLYEALKKTNIVQNYNLISQNLSGGCYYIFDFDKINYFSGKKDLVCNKINQEKRRDNFLKKNQSIVIIGGRLPVYLNGDNLKINRFFDKKTNELPQEYFLNDAGTSFETGVKKSINELLNKGTKVILIYPVPVLEFNPPKKSSIVIYLIEKILKITLKTILSLHLTANFLSTLLQVTSYTTLLNTKIYIKFLLIRSFVVRRKMYVTLTTKIVFFIEMIIIYHLKEIKN